MVSAAARVSPALGFLARAPTNSCHPRGVTTRQAGAAGATVQAHGWSGSEPNADWKMRLEMSI